MYWNVKNAQTQNSYHQQIAELLAELFEIGVWYALIAIIVSDVTNNKAAIARTSRVIAFDFWIKLFTWFGSGLFYLVN